jgi:hypothetical protein
MTAGDGDVFAAVHSLPFKGDTLRSHLKEIFMSCSRIKEILPYRKTLARVARAATGFDYPTTHVGTSPGKVAVYYDPALGNQGLSIAELVLSQADGLMSQMAAAFNTAVSPLNVIIAGLSGTNDGTGGAYHYGCDFRSGGDIYLDACFTEPVFDSFLFVAEASECFMGATDWDCGGSNGEALSRYLAETLVPDTQTAALFASTPVWDQDGRADWIDQTEGTDQDYDSIGCGMAYLYWMAETFTVSRITQAGGSTLEQNYETLTGSFDAYDALMAVLPSEGTITTDDPFVGSPPPPPPPPPPPNPTNQEIAAQIISLSAQIVSLAEQIRFSLSKRAIKPTRTRDYGRPRADTD